MIIPADDDTVDFKAIKGQTMAWYKKVSQKRFKHLPNGYKWDKWMGTALMLTIFAWLFFVAHSYNYSLDYYKCGTMDVPDYMHYTGGEECKNPFYKPENSWKGQEYLPPGEYGTQLGPLFHSAYYSPFLIFGIAFFLNHLIHNRHWRFK